MPHALSVEVAVEFGNAHTEQEVRPIHDVLLVFPVAPCFGGSVHVLVFNVYRLKAPFSNHSRGVVL